MMIYRIVSSLLAPKFKAASSNVLSNFFNFEETTRSTKVVIKANCPKTTNQKLGLNISKSKAKLSSKNKPVEFTANNKEIPKITPGITKGVNAKKYKSCLYLKFSLSNKKAPKVHTITEKTETKNAVCADTQILNKFSTSLKIPSLFSLVPINQSSEKPFQGREGKFESLNANTDVTNKGANKKIKNSIIYNLKASELLFDVGKLLIMIKPLQDFVY